MRTLFRTALLAAAVSLAAACSDSAPSAPATGAKAGPNAGGRAPEVTVMTRNMYIGIDEVPLIEALASPDPTDDVPALLTAITTIQETDFPARAAAMADEIAKERPDVIGLQECDDVLVDLRPMGLPVNIELHFLATLQAELAKRGLNYVVAGQLLSVSADPIPTISLRDHDVILVNADRVTVDPGPITQYYSINPGEVAPGVFFTRGYIIIGATAGGQHVTIANSHFQGDEGNVSAAQLRVLEAYELAGALGTSSPAVVLGDENDLPDSPMHQVFLSAGFTDTWTALHPNQQGFTCCELADLSNPTPVLNQRIDYIWERGFAGGDDLGWIRLVGEKKQDKIAGPVFPIWPSDHAGVVARLNY